MADIALVQLKSALHCSRAMPSKGGKRDWQACGSIAVLRPVKAEKVAMRPRKDFATLLTAADMKPVPAGIAVDAGISAEAFPFGGAEGVVVERLVSSALLLGLTAPGAQALTPVWFTSPPKFSQKNSSSMTA